MAAKHFRSPFFRGYVSALNLMHTVASALSIARVGIVTLDADHGCSSLNTRLARSEQLDWELCRTFIAVADAGSFLGAARRLRTSHPTVGRKIASLEARLGTALFVRSQDGLMLTAQGHRFREHAEAMAAAALRAEASVVTGPKANGNVKLSIGSTLAAHWLMPRMVSFLQDHPNVGIELITHPFPASVRKREADIVLRMFESGDENLVGRRIARLGMGLYASRDYAARRPLPERRDEWKNHSVIGFSDRSSNAELRRWSDRVARHATIATRCSSQADMLAAVRAGLGICPLACFIGNSYADLVRVAPNKIGGLSDMWLLAHPDLIGAPAVRAVMDFVAASARADRNMLRG
jgi:DNA-binding transcriptional LysR family regulator